MSLIDLNGSILAIIYEKGISYGSKRSVVFK